jgi:3',5'-cyclic AMP phosphodiesterase CpdA
MSSLTRRDLLRLSGIGAGAVFVSGLGAGPRLAFGKGAPSGAQDFLFLQLSDTHWGFEGPKVNPEAATTLPHAVEAVNALSQPPDFIVFTGDLTHTTDDAAVRQKRMKEFKQIVSNLKVKDVRFLAGEHDASLDEGKAFKDNFGETHYTFVHKGVHFIAIDNVSDPSGSVGSTQLVWLKKELGKIKKDAPIIVLTHRPLFDLAADWDWTTKDGKDVIDALLPYKNVTVFYGHIHQENHQNTEHIAHHSAKSLIFPLPAPHSVPKKAPIPWDPTHPYQGLGFRGIDDDGAKVTIEEYPVVKV